MSESAPATVLKPRPARPVASRLRPPADSLLWPALAGALFACVQLAFVVPRLGLSWDEVVYVSQVSMHAPAAYFDPARARGIPVLVAPVTLLTSSVLAMRVYLALASGLGLFLALLAWRGLRPAWMLGLAGGLFGSLWVAEYYGPQAMPDLWVALSSLAAVGLFLQATGADAYTADSVRAAARPALRWLAGMAGCLAVAALVRPGDAVFLAAGLVLAGLLVRAWRRWELIAAVAAGLAAGCVEWVAEAYARFGGPLERLHAAGAEQGGFGLHFAIWDELVAANGPTLCRPCTIGLRYPELSLWWLALPVLAVFGVVAARKAGHLRSSLLAAACGLCVAFQYLFLIDYAAPRFLLPAYALAAIPVADGLGWLLTGMRPDRQPLARLLVGLALTLQVLIQLGVLNHQVAEKVAFFGDYTRIATQLHQLGIKPPCLVQGEQDIPIAYYAGCGSAGSVRAALHRSGGAEPVVVLEYPAVQPPGYARHWRLVQLHGIQSKILRLVAYLPPH
jgi:hypothetical protein